MSTNEYTRLRDAATRRAHVLRQQALHAFWDAVLRRFRHLAHLEA
ncbi:hypothetical protein [Ramlibacter paludis]|nr:hypothetical protein [Ramlibacter paludis]